MSGAERIALFLPGPKCCRCGAARVDSSDIAANGWLHGLYFCFGLAVRAAIMERGE